MVMVLACLLCLVSCAYGKPAADTENISRILCCGLPDAADGIELPQESMTETLSWLESFSVGKRVGSKGLPPGSNSYWLIIEYTDGRSVTIGLDAVDIDGVTYYIEREPVPDCFFEVFGRG